MTILDIYKLKSKFRVGDMVVVPGNITHLTHESTEPQIAEVTGLFPNFFDIQYKEGFKQSIQYVDANKIAKVAESLVW